MDLILDRYPLRYRAEVVGLVLDKALCGTSLCLVGLAGSGKSNLITFAQQPPVLAEYAPQGVDPASIHVCEVKCKKFAHAQEGELLASILQCLLPAARACGFEPPAGDTSGDYASTRAVVRHLCMAANRHVLVFLDEFESLIMHQPLDLFEDLRNIRDEVRTTGRFAYVFITHRLPHKVVGNQPFERSSLFLLMRDNLLAFGPYGPADAALAVDSVARKLRVPITKDVRDRIAMVSGGHAGIIQAVFEANRGNINLSARQLQAQGAMPGPVYNACEHIWQHLHSSEREALWDLAHGAAVAPWMLEFLYKRGLINSPQQPQIFSPVFSEYVTSYG